MNRILVGIFAALLCATAITVASPAHYSESAHGLIQRFNCIIMGYEYIVGETHFESIWKRHRPDMEHAVELLHECLDEDADEEAQCAKAAKAKFYNSYNPLDNKLRKIDRKLHKQVFDFVQSTCV